MRVDVHSATSTPLRPVRRGDHRRRRHIGRQIDHDVVRIRKDHRRSARAVVRWGQRLRIVVIVDETVHVMVERVQHRGRENARLAHRTSKELSRRPCPLNICVSPGECRAHRSAESLGEGDHDRLGALGDLG